MTSISGKSSTGDASGPPLITKLWQPAFLLFLFLSICLAEMRVELRVSLNCHQRAFCNALCRLPTYLLAKHLGECTDSSDFTDIIKNDIYAL